MKTKEKERFIHCCILGAIDSEYCDYFITGDKE